MRQTNKSERGLRAACGGSVVTRGRRMPEPCVRWRLVLVVVVVELACDWVALGCGLT